MKGVPSARMMNSFILTIIDDRTFALTNQLGGQEVTDAVEAIIARYRDHDVSYQPSAVSVD
jgi:hypothetical protein